MKKSELKKLIREIIEASGFDDEASRDAYERGKEADSFIDDEGRLTDFDLASSEDLDDEETPLGKINNDEKAIAFLNKLMDKYGSKIVQLWVTSGKYPPGGYTGTDLYRDTRF